MIFLVNLWNFCDIFGGYANSKPKTTTLLKLPPRYSQKCNPYYVLCWFLLISAAAFCANACTSHFCMVYLPKTRLFWYNFTKNMCSTPTSDQQTTINKLMRSPRNLIIIYFDRFWKDSKQIITKNLKIIFWILAG